MIHKIFSVFSLIKIASTSKCNTVLYGMVQFLNSLTPLNGENTPVSNNFCCGVTKVTTTYKIISSELNKLFFYCINSINKKYDF